MTLEFKKMGIGISVNPVPRNIRKNIVGTPKIKRNGTNIRKNTTKNRKIKKK